MTSPKALRHFSKIFRMEHLVGVSFLVLMSVFVETTHPSTGLKPQSTLRSYVAGKKLELCAKSSLSSGDVHYVLRDKSWDSRHPNPSCSGVECAYHGDLPLCDVIGRSSNSAAIKIIGNTDLHSRDKNLTSSDGLLLRVLHETTGATLLHRTFQTWQIFAFGSELVWWLQRLQPGRVATLTVKKEGLVALFLVRKELRAMGSWFADKIPPRDTWIWIWIVRGKTILESLQPSGGVLTGHTVISLAEPLVKRSKYNQSANRNMMRLCSTIEGLGRYCEPGMHDYILERVLHKPGNRDSNIGIALLGGVRPQHLIATFMSLLACPQIDFSNVLILLGTSFETNEVEKSMIDLAEDLQLQYKVIPSLGFFSNKTDQFKESFYFYRSSWSLMVDEFPEYEYLVFLDEDVVVSPDWFSLLTHAAPILTVDPSLWCVTGTPGLRSNYGDPQRLYRGMKQPGWGYLVSRQFAKEAVTAMKVGSRDLYDLWLQMTFAKGKECVYPEVARTNHFGMGINTVPYIHQISSLTTNLYQGPRVNFTSITDLERDNYQKWVVNEIRRSIHHNKDPCKENFFDINESFNSVVLIFPFRWVIKENFLEWYLLAECLGVYGHSPQSMHENALRFSLPRNNSVWIIGVPISAFSRHIPGNIPVWGPKSFKDDVPFQYFPHPDFSNHTYQYIIEDSFRNDFFIGVPRYSKRTL